MSHVPVIKCSTATRQKLQLKSQYKIRAFRLKGSGQIIKSTTVEMSFFILNFNVFIKARRVLLLF